MPSSGSLPVPLLGSVFQKTIILCTVGEGASETMSSEIEDLRFREYWRPAECALVLGLDEAYWRERFNQGIVEGFEQGGQMYVAAASARSHLESRCVERQSGIAVEAALKKIRAESGEAG